MTEEGPIPQTRLDEIQSMLRERLDRAETEELIRRAASDLGFDEVAAVANWRAFTEQDGEVWSYGSTAESWNRLAGECGWAIVRDGRVVDFKILAVN